MPAIAPQIRARTDVDALIDAACVEFAERGYHRTTMASIARRARSTKPTLYAHLGSKDTLHRRVLEREAAHCREWLFARYETAADLPLAEQVTANVQALFDYVAAHPAGFQLLFGSDNSGATLEVRQTLLDTIGVRIVELLRNFQVRHEGRVRNANQQLAETLVGIAVTGAQFATRTNTSLERAGHIASRLCVGALNNL